MTIVPGHSRHGRTAAEIHRDTGSHHTPSLQGQRVGSRQFQRGIGPGRGDGGTGQQIQTRAGCDYGRSTDTGRADLTGNPHPTIGTDRQRPCAACLAKAAARVCDDPEICHSGRNGDRNRPGPDQPATDLQ